jgi:uncharacterized protein (TIGR00730 family)
MKRVCLFCGSSSGVRPQYAAAAAAFGRMLAQEGIGLVYGGARVGLMRVAADATLAAGGEVIGVMPQALVDREVAHSGLPDLRIVGSMHERKALMAELSDGFVALPGGLGTFEELLEVITWSLLGFHAKPCGVLNIEGYYDRLVGLIDHAVVEGFVNDTDRELIVVADTPRAVLERLRAWRPRPIARWIALKSEL